MHLDPIIVAVLVGAFVLAAGAAMRMVAHRVAVPYTVGMLLIGIGGGLLLRLLDGQGLLHEGFRPLVTGDVLSNHLILFVFLPALVFESALAMDVYAFSKNLGAVLILAVPALLVATFATAAMMVGLTAGGWQWSLGVALVFGALISATDPVAVVSILRDLGAPKRLSLLIEGESLLNDGTSIVVFTVLVGLLTAGVAAAGHADGHAVAADAGPLAQLGDATLRFLVVVGGGLIVGALLAAATSFALSRIFDDPLVEVTLMIALAYLCMIIAEGLLHVSGIVAVVIAGLWMAGPGRQSVSPGAAQTIHRFWEILAYLANTLIFCLAGFVIAAQLDTGDLTLLWLAPAAWLGINLIRFAVVFAFRPLLGGGRASDERVDARQATVIAWGGLRGAVSLALALYVWHLDGLPADTGGQMMRVTATVVFLSVAINGSTTGWLLRRLGFDRVPPAEQVARLEAHRTVLETVDDAAERLSQSPNLRLHAWATVRDQLARRVDDLRHELRHAQQQVDIAGAMQERVTLWRQALGIERSAVNRAYADGTLSPVTVQVMELEIDFHADRLNAGRLEPPPARGKGIYEPGLAQWARRLGALVGTRAGDLSFLYDLARAEALSARAVLDGLQVLEAAAADHPDDAGPAGAADSTAVRVRDEIRATYTDWLRNANDRLEDLRVNLPEVTQEIEMRLARRIELNLERDNYRRLRALGVIDEALAREALDSIQRRTKHLQFARLTATVPTIRELCRLTALFRRLDEPSTEALAAAIHERVFEKGAELFHEGDDGDSVYLIARGAVHVTRGSGDAETLLDVAGGGEIVGEMALLTGQPRNATARAATTVVVGEIDGRHFRQLMAERPEVRVQVVAAFARHGFDNYIRNSPDWQRLSHDDVREWARDVTPVQLAEGEAIAPDGDGYVFVVAGAVRRDGDRLRAPILLSATDAAGATADAESWIVRLGPAPKTTAPANVVERMTRRITRATYESRKLSNS